MIAAGLQAILASSIEANAIFKLCLNKLWRLGFAEFRSLDRLARAARASSENCHAFVSEWNSSMGQMMRLLQNTMMCCCRLLQRSALAGQIEKTAAIQAVILPAMASAAWLSDFDQIISTAPLPMTRGFHQSAATLISLAIQNISHVHEDTRDARISQLFRNGSMVKLQVLAYSWQLEKSDTWAARTRAFDGEVVAVLLDMWQQLPDPIVCSALCAVMRTVLQYPHLHTLPQDVSTHAFISSSFLSIAPSFSSDISAIAVAVNEALPTLLAMHAFDIFRAAACANGVFGCVVECCLRAWATLNVLLLLDDDLLLVAVDAAAAKVRQRQPHESDGSRGRVWVDPTALLDPLLMWSDHYIRISDYESGGATALSTCPSPCPHTLISLPLCHLTILATSTTFIITMCNDTPAFKDTLTSNPLLLQSVKSAILQYAALFRWANLVRAGDAKALAVYNPHVSNLTCTSLTRARLQVDDAVLRACGEAAAAVNCPQPCMSHFTSQLVADMCTGSQVGEGGVLEPQRQAAGACFAAVAKATRNIIMPHPPPSQLLQVLQADGGGGGVGESLKSKIEAAAQAWQQSKHEGTCDTQLQSLFTHLLFLTVGTCARAALQGAAEGLVELLDALAAL